MKDPMLGTMIGNYRLVSLLGEGGMGRVYMGEHPEIGRRVAIKLILRQDEMPAAMTQRFIAEARAVARIPHSGIIDIFDFGRTATGALYYTMEMLEGCELEDVLTERGRLHHHEVVAYARQICSALQAAHDRGVVHRDQTSSQPTSSLSAPTR
jgi:serine/threonine protein kinase